MNPIVSVLITFAAYALIPLIIVYSTKEPIQAKKYQNYCFGGNLVVFAIFVIINMSSGGAAAYNAGYLIGYNAAPYALWTAIGCAIGSSVLKKKGLYIKKGETAPTNSSTNNTVTFTGNAQTYSAPQKPASNTQQPQYSAPQSQQQSQPYRPAQSQQQSQPYSAPQQHSSNYNPQQYNGGYAQPQYGAQPQSAAPKFCIHCGNQLTPGSRFCSNCGADTTK